MALGPPEFRQERNKSFMKNCILLPNGWMRLEGPTSHELVGPSLFRFPDVEIPLPKSLVT